MMTYILLRNNKETGPHSIEDLRQLGLRQDDLIWVEGQSVYWLAPDQINELKSIPLDQPARKEESTPALQAVLPILPPDEEEPVLPADPIPSEPVLQHESVQPGGYASLKKQESVNDAWKNYIPAEKSASPAVKKIEPRPVAEVREMYTPPRPRKIALSPRLVRSLPYALLFTVGIIAGILITGNKKKQTTVAKQPVTLIPKNDSNAQASSLLPVTDSASPPLTRVDNKTVQAEHKQLTEEPVQSEGKEVSDKTENTVEPKTPVEKNAGTDEKADARPQPAENIANLVSVKNNDYIVASFGGIRNLELTVKNDSRYTLDKVVVELQYLKPRDELLRTENVLFYLVPPNGKQTVAVKKSNRGVKIAHRIVRIECKEIGL